MQRALRNIDYFSHGISNRIINEIAYQFEPVTLNKNDYLFQAGEISDSIYIISQGELDIHLKNTRKTAYLDTLYTGCTIGSYGCISSELYTTSAYAKTECAILRLSYVKLQNMRKNYEALDKIMVEYEKYIENSYPPI